MAEEISSIATSSVTPPNWWPDLHSGSLSSWSSNTNPWQTPNPNSNSSGEEDVSISTSFTNASNHSGLSVESSRRLVDHSASANELIGETPSDNQLWSHLLLSVGSSGELSSTPEVEENSINILSSKSYSSGMFEPACDYLKKMDNTWGFTNPPTTFNNFEKHFNESFMESESLNKLSNLVHHWSIAPPDSRIRRFDPRSATNMDTFSCYNHEQRVKGEQGDIEAPGALFRHFMNTNGSDYQMGLKNSILGDNGTKYYCGMPDVPCTSARSLGDVTFNGFLTKPSVDIPSSKRLLRSLNLSDSKRQGIVASPRPAISVSQTVTRSNVRGQAITSEGKKKRTEDSSEAASKKSKHEVSTVQSTKVPKVKITDKITALQQIVSPFGKTDTASVLGEAIVNIKCLQDQVQLLISNPYMKTSASKDPWGSLESRDKGDMKVDLKSRGLCLVPISCTPQVYRENTGSDYWAPTYRGCLYR